MSNELWHYGIKGQQKGVRRFQNEDGTLTIMGKQRYGIGEKELHEYAKKIAAVKNSKSVPSEKQSSKGNRKSGSSPMFTVHSGGNDEGMKRTLEMLKNRIGEDALSRLLSSRSMELLKTVSKSSDNSRSSLISESTKRKIVQSSLLGKEYVEKFLNYKKNGGKS